MSRLDKITDVMMRVNASIEQQRHIQAIKDGMIAIIPIILLGSFALVPTALINLFPHGGFAAVLTKMNPFFTYPIGFTTGLLSLYSAFFIAYSLAKKSDLNAPVTAMNAVLVQVILSSSTVERTLDLQYLGAEGIFVSIIAALLTVEIARVLYSRNLYIKLPADVPPMVFTTFKSLVPLIASTFISVTIVFLCNKYTGQILTPNIMQVLAPAFESMDSLGAIIAIVFLTQILWFFGIHGAAVTSSFWVPFAILYGAENVANHAMGLPVTHFFTFGFYYSLLQVTGSGLTLGLVTLMLFSKAHSYKSLGRAGIIPSLFGINEPIIFGLPIILNPIMFVPFVFGPIITAALSYWAMSTGVVGMPIVEPPSFMPPGVGAFLMTYDYKAVILVFFNLLLMTLFYYPFFKLIEKNELKLQGTK